MCAWYLLSGTVRLRRGPEVDAILEELRDLRGDEFEITTIAAGPGTIEFRLRGDSEFTDAGADELDDLLRSLGRHALEPAVITGEYDGERRDVFIEPGGQACPTACGIPIRGTVR